MFTLAYHSEGAFQGPPVMDMEPDEREFYMGMLARQLEKEAKAVKAAQQTARGKSRFRR